MDVILLGTRISQIGSIQCDHQGLLNRMQCLRLAESFICVTHKLVCDTRVNPLCPLHASPHGVDRMEKSDARHEGLLKVMQPGLLAMVHAGCFDTRKMR